MKPALLNWSLQSVFLQGHWLDHEMIEFSFYNQSAHCSHGIYNLTDYYT